MLRTAVSLGRAYRECTSTEGTVGVGRGPALRRKHNSNEMKGSMANVQLLTPACLLLSKLYTSLQTTSSIVCLVVFPGKLCVAVVVCTADGIIIQNVQ